jgi:hypothetical protein
MSAPWAYVEWVNEHLGFNPRGQTNSDALSDLVTTDLVRTVSLLGNAITSGALTPRKNADVKANFATRNIDLVFDEANNLQMSSQVSVENKTIMAAHGKARKNRYGDIIAYCNHMHNHRRECVAGAIVVVNVSGDPRWSGANPTLRTSFGLPVLLHYSDCLSRPHAMGRFPNGPGQAGFALGRRSSDRFLDRSALLMH